MSPHVPDDDNNKMLAHYLFIVVSRLSLVRLSASSVIIYKVHRYTHVSLSRYNRVINIAENRTERLTISASVPDLAYFHLFLLFHSEDEFTFSLNIYYLCTVGTTKSYSFDVY